jgi:hypothetical protein
MIKNILLLVLALPLICGCGGKIRELRAEFIEGCKNTGGSKNVCSCVFDKMQDNYSEEELLRMKVGVLPKGFIEFSGKSTLQCMKDA